MQINPFSIISIYNPLALIDLFVRDFEKILSLSWWIRSALKIGFFSFSTELTNNNMLSAFVQLTVGKGRSGSAWLTNIFTLLFMHSLSPLEPRPPPSIHNTHNKKRNRLPSDKGTL